MAKKDHNSSQVKLLRVNSNVIKGFSYRVKNDKGFIQEKKYFGPERCKGLIITNTTNGSKDFDFNDNNNEHIYEDFIKDIDLIKLNKEVTSFLNNPSSSLTLTLLHDSINLKDEINFAKNSTTSSYNSTGAYLSDTLSYLFGEGDSKLKAKKIIESLKKQKKITAPSTSMSLSDNIYGDIVKNIPKKRGRPPKIPIEAKISKIEKIPKKRGRPPTKQKGLFNVYDPSNDASMNSSDNVSTSLPNLSFPKVEGIMNFTNETKSEVLKKTNSDKKKTTKKKKAFSAFAETYKPLNGYLSETSVAQSDNLSQNFSVLEHKPTIKSVTGTASKEDIIKNSLKQQLQAGILARLRFQNSDTKSDDDFKNDIVNLQNAMILNLIQNSNIKDLNISLSQQNSITNNNNGNADSQGAGKIQFGEIETIQTFPKNSVKIKKDLSLSNSEPVKTLETPEVVISRLFSSDMDQSLENPDYNKKNLTKVNTDFNVRSASDYIVASALNDVAASVISKKGPYVKYKHLLEFVAITLNEDKSNSVEVLENLSAEIVPAEFSNMDQKQKQKFLFGVNHLSVSLMKFKGNSNGLFKQQNMTIDNSNSSFQNSEGTFMESADTSEKATTNELYSQNILSKNDMQNAIESDASLKNSFKNSLINYDDSSNVLKKLALKDFNAKTSEELRMEARLEQLKEEALKLGVELTQEKITKLIQQVAEEQLSQSNVENDLSKLKKGRKIRKNYVLPPEPHKKSLYYEQEHKKYLAAKDYLLNPGKTSLREVCQRHKISVPTLITYMDAGRVARMLVTGKYSGSTVIRDSSFNNRGTSSFPEQIKSLYLQKTYEKILEAKKKTIESNGSTDDDVVMKLTLAKQQLAMQQQQQQKQSLSNVKLETQTPDLTTLSQCSEMSSAPGKDSGSIAAIFTENSSGISSNFLQNQNAENLQTKLLEFSKNTQEELADKILKAKNPDEIALILLDSITNIVTNKEDTKKQLLEKIHIKQLSKECVEAMRNSVEGIVDSNFDFENFLEGTFKKKRGRGAPKKSIDGKSLLNLQK